MMSAEQNKAIVREFVAAADKLDFEAATRFISPDIVVHIGGGPAMDFTAFFGFGQMYHAAFPDEVTVFDDQIAEGDKVVSRMTSTATHLGEFQGIPPTGRQIRLTGIWIDRIINGKIVERWGEFDVMGLMQQLGAIPTPAR
jgi:predicted ester cyclase